MKKWTSVGLLCLLVLVVFFSLGRKKELPREGAVQQQKDDELEVRNLTPYDKGVVAGYYTFMGQFGYKVDEKKQASYTSWMEEDPEEYARGYTDGYHRAADQMSCPRHR